MSTASQVIEKAESQSTALRKIAAEIEQADKLRARWIVIQQELRTLRGRIPHAEHVGRVQQWLRRIGDRFVAPRERSSGGAATVDMRTTAGDLVAGLARYPEPVAPVLTDDNFKALVFWLLGPELEAAVPRALAQLPAPADAPPGWTEQGDDLRAPRIAELEAERTELHRVYSAIESRAKTIAGVTLAELPGVGMYRTEREQRERAAKAAAAQAEAAAGPPKIRPGLTVGGRQVRVGSAQA